MRYIRLGVNIDHVATIRNARGGAHPDPIRAALLALDAGADGTTLHLREDRRHIREEDVARLKQAISAPINLEMAATDAMVSIALAVRPHAVCLVPERRQEITTEGGLDAASQRRSLSPIVSRLSDAGSVSLHRSQRTADRSRKCVESTRRRNCTPGNTRSIPASRAWMNSPVFRVRRR